MNPMTNVKNIQKLNDRMLKMEVEDEISWHKQYKDSAYVFIGGLPYDLTEGDILCVFSQYGEIVDINLVRDKATGNTKGYGFLCYENQKSTILAVDNLNGIKLGGRTIRVDHVSDYKRPKSDEKDDNGERKELPLVTCAPKTPPSSEGEEIIVKERKKKKKKEKSKKREKRQILEMKDIGDEREDNLEKGRKIPKLSSDTRDSGKDNISDTKWKKEMSRNVDSKILKTEHYAEGINAKYLEGGVKEEKVKKTERDGDDTEHSNKRKFYVKDRNEERNRDRYPDNERRKTKENDSNKHNLQRLISTCFPHDMNKGENKGKSPGVWDKTSTFLLSI